MEASPKSEPTKIDCSGVRPIRETWEELIENIEEARFKNSLLWTRLLKEGDRRADQMYLVACQLSDVQRQVRDLSEVGL